MGNVKLSTEKTRKSMAAAAERRARAQNPADILKDTVVVKTAGQEGGVQFFFSPDKCSNIKTFKDSVAYPLATHGLIYGGSEFGIVELRFGGKTMLGVSLREDDKKTQDIVWEYSGEGELTHRHINELRLTLRDEAAKLVFQHFAEQTKSLPPQRG